MMTAPTDPFVGAGTYLDVSFPDYLTGAFGPEEGSLSASGAKTILHKSPMHFAYERAHPTPSTDAMEVGTAVHTLVLGDGVPVDVLPFDNWRTGDAQKARKAAKAEGRIAFLEHEYVPVQRMAEAVLADKHARPLLERESHVEASLFAQDPESGVWLRIRPDSLPCDGKRTTILDLKKLESADPRKFRATAPKYGYDLSNWLYPFVHSLVTGEEDSRFAFIVVEATQPHPVQVFVMDDEFRRGAQTRMRKAIDTYAACSASGHWPAYSDDIELIEAPFWYFADSEEMSAA